jgi:curved DNA-binding protein CbpA
MNPYETLGLSPGPISEPAVERAYKSRARQAHPDRNGGSTEEMSALNLARDILLNPERKRRFDETGSTSSGPLSLEEQAIWTIGNIFARAIEEAPEGVPHSRILAAVAKNLAEGLERALKMQSSRPKQIRRARGLLKSIQCDPLLRRALESRIDKLDRETAEINQQVELGRFMLRLLESVEFKS